MTTAYEHTVEAFTPPWLLQGTPRPVIKKVPVGVIPYGTDFFVEYTGSISRVSIISPTSTTHGTDFTQRLIFVKIIAKTDTRLTLRAPPNATIALQGYHMLFLMNGDTPSLAQWIQLG
jgi:hypothetical protein